MKKKLMRIGPWLLGLGALGLLALLTITFACTLEPEIAEIHKEVIEANSYTVTFNVGEGKYPVASQRVLRGLKAALPTPHPKYDPTETKTFGWWFRANPSAIPTPDPLIPWDFERNTVSGDMTLYASWDGHTVVFFGNGGKIDTKDFFVVSSITGGDSFSTVSAPVPGPMRDEYKFAKWTTKPGGGTDVLTTTTIDKSIAVYAQWDKTITLKAIPGVTAPATGKTPVTTINSAQYTGTVTWTPGDDPFEAKKVYTAAISLTAKDGYTLDGVTANFFTVAGIPGTNIANDGNVVVSFPATLAGKVVLAAGSDSGLTVGDEVITVAADAYYQVVNEGVTYYVDGSGNLTTDLKDIALIHDGETITGLTNGPDTSYRVNAAKPFSTSPLRYWDFSADLDNTTPITTKPVAQGVMELPSGLVQIIGIDLKLTTTNHYEIMKSSNANLDPPLWTNWSDSRVSGTFDYIDASDDEIFDSSWDTSTPAKGIGIYIYDGAHPGGITWLNNSTQIYAPVEESTTDFLIVDRSSSTPNLTILTVIVGDGEP